MVLGSSRRVSSLIDFLSPHVLFADPTLPPPPAPTPGGMRALALAHLAGQGDRTVHGARPASRRLPADPPDPPDPPRPGRGRPAPGPAGDAPGQARRPARRRRLVAGVGQPRGRRGGQPEVRGGTRAADRGPGPGPFLAGALFTPERAGSTPPDTRTAPPGGGAVLGFCANSVPGGLGEFLLAVLPVDQQLHLLTRQLGAHRPVVDEQAE